MKQKRILGITGADWNSSTKHNVQNLRALPGITLANTGGIHTALTSVGPLVIATHQDFTVCSCSGPHPLER